jgi:acetyltransferase
VVTIRQIRTDDAERLQTAHERLSPESRYRRFMSSKPHLSTADTRYLVDIDGFDHYALVATHPDDGGDAEAIVAVARFVRIASDPETAEFAIVVGDLYQRQGLATSLMSALAAAAAERGVLRFRAEIFSDNVAITRLMEALAVGEPRCRRLGSICEVEIDLPARPGEPVEVEIGLPAPEMIAGCAGS